MGVTEGSAAVSGQEGKRAAPGPGAGIPSRCKKQKNNGQKRSEGPPLRLATPGGTAGLLGVLLRFSCPLFLEVSPWGSTGGLPLWLRRDVPVAGCVGRGG